MLRNHAILLRLVSWAAIFVLLCGAGQAEETARMRVAEWGTFTVLQDEAGRPLAGVNVNEESLPNFVHRLGYHLIPQASQISPFAGMRSKGLPSSYPYAIMRMETPIIYFYPTEAQKKPLEIDVSVGFRGGWISEWYPRAEVQAPGFKNAFKNMGIISPDQTGTIRWKNLRVGADVKLPETTEHVWLAPRDVDSARVVADGGQAEQYLFYRGVANIEAPLRVLRSRDDTLSIETNGRLLQPTEECKFSAMWLADIRPDGKIAFRELSPATIRGQAKRQSIATTPGAFSKMEYSKANLGKLQTSMRGALLRDGLTADEADAMLATWKLSYFQSPGLRLFFSLPRSWTDAILPLSISAPADITRVMIGRIELVTPQQRKLLEKLAQVPASTSTWFTDAVNKAPAAQRGRMLVQLIREETTFADLGIAVPKDYQAYLDLGRFRDAILLDRQRQKPNETLKKFVANYGIRGFGAAPAGNVKAQEGVVSGGE